MPPAGATPGDLDPSFGGDGIALSGLQDLDEFNAEFDVAVQADGKVVVVGNDADDVLVVRFGTDGELDPTFSDDGVATVDFDPTRPARQLRVRGRDRQPGSHPWAVGPRALGRASASPG